MTWASREQTQNSEKSEPRHYRIWKHKVPTWYRQSFNKTYGKTRTVEHKTGTVVASMIMKIMKLKEKNLKQS